MYVKLFSYYLSSVYIKYMCICADYTLVHTHTHTHAHTHAQTHVRFSVIVLTIQVLIIRLPCKLIEIFKIENRCSHFAKILPKLI